MKRPAVFLCALLWLLCQAGFGYAQAADRATVRRSIFQSELEARGQYDALLASWLDSVRRDPDSLESNLILGRLHDIQDYCNDFWGPVSAFVGDVDGRRMANGFNAQSVDYWRAQCLERAGDAAGAQAALDRTGLISHALICGPFGYPDYPQAYFDTAYPPETEIDLAKTYASFPGAYSSAAWLATHASPGSIWMNPGQMLEEHGCIYALCQVNMPEARDVILDCLIPAPWKLWINGHPAFVADARERRIPNSISLRVSLSVGWNSLLLKLPFQQNFALAVTGLDGRPVDDLRVESERMTWNLKSETAAPAVEILSYPEKDLEAELAADPNAVFPRLALSRLLRRRDPDAQLNLARRAAELEPSPATHMAVEQALRFCRLYSGTWLTTRRKEAIDAALAADPEHVPALIRLAEYEYDNEHFQASFDTFDRAASAAPELAYVHFRKAQLAHDRGWLRETREFMHRAEELSPRNSDMHRFWAEYYAGLNNHQKELDIYFQIREWDKSSGIEERIADILSTMGRFDEAIAHVSAMLETQPNDPNLLQRLAGLYAQSGNRKKAIAMLRQALQVNGAQPSLRRELADLTYLQGDAFDDAMRQYETLAAAEPSNDGLRRFLQYKHGVNEDFAAPWIYQGADLAAEGASLPPAEDADIECLLRQQIVEFYPDYSHSVITHEMYKVITTGGQDALGELQPQGELLGIRTYTAKGEVMEPIQVSGSGFVMPALEVDAMVEHRYRQYSFTSDPLTFETAPFFFQDENFMFPIRRAEFVLIVPDGLAIDIRPRNLKAEAEVSRRDGATVTRYVLRDMPKLQAEALMPDADKVLPNLYLAARRERSALLPFYTPNPDPDEYPTELLRQTAAGLVQGTATRLEQARAIYAFVNREITSDQGESNANAALVEKAGDRATLFRALAKIAGIPIVIGHVRANEKFLDPIDASYVRLRDYGTPLTGFRLEDGAVQWLSFANRYDAFGELPPELGGGSVLIPAWHNNGEAIVVTLPESDPERYTNTDTVDVTVNADGSAAGRLTSLIPGEQAAQIKEMIAQADYDQLKNDIAQQLNTMVRGAAVSALSFEGKEEFGADLKIIAEFTVKKFFLSVKPESAKLPLCMQPMEIGGFTNVKERHFDFDWRGMFRARSRTIVRLDAAFAPGTLPTDVAVAVPGLSYTMTFKQDGNVITCERLLHLEAFRFPKEQYSKLVEVTAAADRADENTIEIRIVPKETAPVEPPVKDESEKEPNPDETQNNGEQPK